ncbi:interferon-induced very large GTPase 1-like [Brachyhypopomus gauderio]|uniref:interferon-induced very large GTPase 1-like n=1 Tax=Brachyhypopomus gauderio TaxID=698409 RepID=UPI00404197BD
MNYILNDNKHPAFFSRHFDGNTKTRLLLDGVTEISWYCPGGSKHCIFQECVSLINLHGDANKHPGQLEFIQRISSVIVVLLPEDPREPEIVESVKRLQEPKIPLIFLFTGVEHAPSSSDNRIAAKNRNDAELKREIVLKVTCALLKQKEVQSLESHIDTAIKSGLIATTESKEVWNGQERAKHLMDILGINGESQRNNDKLLGLKDEYLPLQGDHWKSWSKCDKEVHRLHSRRDISIDQQLTEIVSKKNKIRKGQLAEAQNLNNFMAQFFKYALPRTETSERIAMLNRLKKYLDDAFTGVVAHLQDQYNTTWIDHRRHTAKDDRKVQLADHLQAISEKINSAAFDVHHIIRETGQIYEAICSSGELRAVSGFEVNVLPEFGAEIMMSGRPIELLDGDANHIPLEWISAVLQKLIQNIGDQRVFVISVVGLQSSGKSTLLNALFGLQFAVSAGRCTKGAFMQLVPVHEELRNQLHFDYVLLVDTEGLRSVEADASLTHDNELATFVVGLGDVTIINVMGENTAEIQDFLQICFQAFLRMSSVEIKPCCFLVHQNITETAAKHKTQEGRRQLISKLDEMSKIAAQAEDREVTGFSDIIQFDAETHVFYFKNYFDGDPPMAPPNPSYSQNAQELKTKLLSIAEWQDGCKLPLISEVRTRIQHLWNALMKENFVFHFKNSLHIMVYSKLEEQYGKWSWTLRKFALETQNTLHHKISSSESYDIPTGQFKQDFNSIYQDVKVDVDRYFREELYSDILVQWRDNIDKKLESLIEDLMKETRDNEQELIKMKKKNFSNRTENKII